MPSLRRWLAAMPRTAVACALLAGGAFAQEPDILDRTKRLQEVAIQQVEAETRLAMAEAVRTGVGDKPKALEMYRTILRKLESDSVLPQDKRDSLVRIVKDRIQLAETSAAADAEDAA